MDQEALKFIQNRIDCKLQELVEEDEELQKQCKEYYALQGIMEQYASLNREKEREILKSVFPEFLEGNYLDSYYKRITENEKNINFLKNFLDFSNIESK